MAWSKRAIEWTEGHDAYLSVVFTWDLPEAYQRAVWLAMEGYDVHAGGPAVKLMPDYLADVATCNGREIPALHLHNPLATITSRGCIRRCPFCAVPRIEGDLVELDEWPIAPVVCDNNLLACSRAHFDSVVDSLKGLRKVDIQGVDARVLTDYHAERLAELDCILHIGFDDVGVEPPVVNALEQLHRAGFEDKRLRVYVLIGYNDTPEEALYRLRLVRELGAWPFPMRYQPLDALAKHSYVDPNWTERELLRMSRYWARSMFFERIGVAYEDYERW
jgi:hypothetical protein